MKFKAILFTSLLIGSIENGWASDMPPDKPLPPTPAGRPALSGEEANDPQDYGKLAGVHADVAHCTDAFKASCTEANCRQYAGKFNQCKRCDISENQLKACLKGAAIHIEKSKQAALAAAGGGGTLAALIYIKLAVIEKVLGKQKALTDALSLPISGTIHRDIQPPQEIRGIMNGFPLVQGLLADIRNKYPSLQTQPGPNVTIEDWDNMLISQANSVIATTTGTLAKLVVEQINQMHDKKRGMTAKSKAQKEQLKTILTKVTGENSTFKREIQKHNQAGTSTEYQLTFLDNLSGHFQDALKEYQE